MLASVVVCTKAARDWTPQQSTMDEKGLHGDLCLPTDRFC